MVILIMGVSGSGKSTLGSALAGALGGRWFCDGDDYHPAANIAKMRGGGPLTDEDRAAWLRTLRSSIDAWLREDNTTVLACSALTERIRRTLGTDREGIRLVHLRGSKQLIDARMRERDHFMPAALLDSQFAILEPPECALDLDISRTPEELVATIMSRLKLTAPRSRGQ